MAACTPSIHVFLGRPLFLLSSGTHSIINFGILRFYIQKKISRIPFNFRFMTHTWWSAVTLFRSP